MDHPQHICEESPLASLEGNSEAVFERVSRASKGQNALLSSKLKHIRSLPRVIASPYIAAIVKQACAILVLPMDETTWSKAPIQTTLNIRAARLVLRMASAGYYSLPSYQLMASTNYIPRAHHIEVLLSI